MHTISTNHTEKQGCPQCGGGLHSDGKLLRCASHGQFFRYGPRLLVAVARADDESAPLLPWQTLEVGKHK